MIHTPTDVVLLALIALWYLVVVSRLLLLLWSLPLSTVIELTWSVLGISLRPTVGIVNSLTTPEPCVTTSGNMSVVSHTCSNGVVFAILRETRALH
jgi:hypothetical protein